MEGPFYRSYVPKSAYHHQHHVNNNTSKSRTPSLSLPRSPSSPTLTTTTTPTITPPRNRNNLFRRVPSASSISSIKSVDYRRDSASLQVDAMDALSVIDRRDTRGSTSTNAANHSSQSLLANPFELRHGRRYLRDVPYPLPCDLSEIHRQNLRTLVGCTVFSKPSCAPEVAKNVPKRVLELGCGSAYWTSTCHEWFTSLGHPNVEFTGLDVAPLAPDLKSRGVNWKFVQHDFRRYPWPFEDAAFDFVMLKDLSLTVEMGVESQRFIDETLRILSPKGTLEIWESDHVLRCLLPEPPSPRGTTADEEQTARATKTYLISPATPFAAAQNKYVADANAWIHSALDKLNLPSSPCARMADYLYSEPDTLKEVSMRRVAIPLGQLRWEKDSEGKMIRSNSSGNLFGTPPKGKAKGTELGLTDEQAALRSTALLTCVQKVESLEPLLKEASGKNAEEWTRWWSNMMKSQLDQAQGSSGEVLEVGAWWATRI